MSEVIGQLEELVINMLQDKIERVEFVLENSKYKKGTIRADISTIVVLKDGSKYRAWTKHVEWNEELVLISSIPYEILVGSK